MNWQPISTAPTDKGVYIVAYLVRFHRGSWDAPLTTERRVTPLHWDGEWNCLGADGRAGFAYEVTHWMPLPAPPVVATDDQPPSEASPSVPSAAK